LVIVQAMIASSYKAKSGAVTSELQVTSATGPSNHAR
jgi:hypothetical protein